MVAKNGALLLAAGGRLFHCLLSESKIFFVAKLKGLETVVSPGSPKYFVLLLVQTKSESKRPLRGMDRFRP